jgi:hypothetical protein
LKEKNTEVINVKKEDLQKKLDKNRVNKEEKEREYLIRNKQIVQRLNEVGRA